MSLYNSFTGGRATSAADIADVVAGYETGMGRYLRAKIDQGYWNSLLGQGIETLSLPDSALTTLQEQKVYETTPRSFADDVREREFERDSATGAIPPPERQDYQTQVTRELDKRGIAYLGEEDWKASPYYREAMPFEPFMTAERAAAKADVYDDNEATNFFIEKRQNGALGAVLGFGAAMLGGAPDPTNWIGLGWIRRAGLAGKGLRGIGRSAAAGAAEAGVVTAATEPLLAASLGFWGDDITWGEAVLDIALGAATGGTFAGAGRAFSLRMESRQTTALARAEDAMNAAADLSARAAELPVAVHKPLDGRLADRAAEDLNYRVGEIAQHRQPKASPPILGREESARGVSISDLSTPEKVAEPQSLVSFLRDQGGIKDTNGELAAVNALEARGKPGEKRLVDENGRDLDYAREAAEEAGYLPEGSTVNDLLDALDSEFRGQKVYSRADENNVQAFREQEKLKRREGEIRSEMRALEKRAAKEMPGEIFSQGALREAAARFVDQGEDGLSHLADLVERRAMQSEPAPQDAYRELKQEDWDFLDEMDADLAAYREADQAGALNAEDRAAFEAADAEVKRMEKIEEAFKVANLCVMRGGG